MFSAEEKYKAVERELAYRKRVYARRATEGKMSQQFADRQIAVFDAIRDDYRRWAYVEKVYPLDTDGSGTGLADGTAASSSH
jgi:hypothetical protein